MHTSPVVLVMKIRSHFFNYITFLFNCFSLLSFSALSILFIFSFSSEFGFYYHILF